jgi:hypothetical protein
MFRLLVMSKLESLVVALVVLALYLLLGCYNSKFVVHLGVHGGVMLGKE